jgi:ABC-2 type transport system permease protein
VTDILTVARKELREIIGGGSGRKSLIREVFFVFLFGVFFPLSQAEAWRSGAVPTVFVFMIPLFLAGPYIADTFAGERERKTLETLLATRLPDSSIYLGKILAVCTYAWAVTQLILLASLLALNVAGGAAAEGAESGRWFVYPTPVWVGALAGSYASALFISGIGTFISLRSETVRSAHQAMMLPLAPGHDAAPVRIDLRGVVRTGCSVAGPAGRHAGIDRHVGVGGQRAGGDPGCRDDAAAGGPVPAKARSEALPPLEADRALTGRR